MSTRIQEWLQTENKAIKSNEQLRAENPGVTNGLEYNEKIVQPWLDQHLLENELRKKIGAPPNWATDEEKIEFHRRQLALLEKANQAPRCGHVYSDGTRCRSPKLRQDKVCYAHARMLAVKPRRLNLPPLEDANAVMLWLMEVSRALLEGEITERTAGLLFYGLQMAMTTARWTTFAQTKPEEMVRSMGKGESQPLPEPTLRAKNAQKVRHPHPRRHGDTRLDHSEIIPGDESDKSLVFGDKVRGDRGDRDPSTPPRQASESLRISPAGSDARKAAQDEVRRERG